MKISIYDVTQAQKQGYRDAVVRFAEDLKVMVKSLYEYVQRGENITLNENHEALENVLYLNKAIDELMPIVDIYTDKIQETAKFEQRIKDLHTEE